MDRTRTSTRMLCHVCQHPALSMDEARVPFCPRHVKVALARRKARDAKRTPANKPVAYGTR